MMALNSLMADMSLVCEHMKGRIKDFIIRRLAKLIYENVERHPHDQDRDWIQAETFVRTYLDHREMRRMCQKALAICAYERFLESRAAPGITPDHPITCDDDYFIEALIGLVVVNEGLYKQLLKDAVVSSNPLSLERILIQDVESIFWRMEHMLPRPPYGKLIAPRPE